MANGINNKKDDDLQALLAAMAQKAPEHQAELGLTAQQVQQIQDASAAFEQAQQGAHAALCAYRAAIEAKDGARHAAIELTARLIAGWKPNPDVSDATLADVGVERDRKRRRAVPVHRPGEVLVTTGNTVNALSWSPNGNEYRTVYIIESRASEREEWRFIAATTRTKLAHTGQRPGATVWYRVYAQRAGRNSGPTVPSAAYGEQSLQTA
ncbi:MAG: fibronectin type III domain-containing protein [Fimbriimonadaceae bacterium]